MEIFDLIDKDEPIYPERDMELARNIIAKLNQEKRDAMRMVWAIVKVAGGEVNIPLNVLIEMDENRRLERFEEPFDKSIVFRAL